MIMNFDIVWLLFYYFIEFIVIIFYYLNDK